VADNFGSTATVATGPDSVLVVTGNFLRGLLWGWLSDTSFTEMGKLNESEHFSESYPMLRRRPSGGYWLFWGDTDTMLFARTFRGGAWTAIETLRVAVPTGIQHFLYESIPSQDDEEYPALMTSGYGIRGDTRDYIYVSFPTDSGFGVAERVDASRYSRIQTMGMDENGDVWLAWFVLLDGIFWTHSYTTSTASAPSITERGGRPFLRWRLSEPSPRTWWGVMRSVNGQPFECVARVRAGPVDEMSWADAAAPANARIEYAIRRECRDVRFQATSEAAGWEPRRAVLGLALKGPNPASERVEFELLGASAGDGDVRLYDLQGRVVAAQKASLGGSGRDIVTFRAGRDLRSGLYLLLVSTDDGKRATPRKVVLIR
jgi:hypothetical protein